MAGKKPGGHVCLPEAAGAVDDLQSLLIEALYQERKGKPERSFERGLFPVHLHEGTFRLPGLPHRQEANPGPSGFPAPSGRPALVFSLPLAVHASPIPRNPPDPSPSPRARRGRGRGIPSFRNPAIRRPAILPAFASRPARPILKSRPGVTILERSGLCAKRKCGV